MNITNNSVYLELFLGPMFSGKSTKLTTIMNQYKLCDVKTILFNHIIDKIRSVDRLKSNDTINDTINDTMVTYDHLQTPCVYTNSCKDMLLYPLYKECSVILINEGQFFDDIYDGVIQMLADKKRVYICGLDGDYLKCVFNTNLLKLIPLCDKVTKLHSICLECKNGSPAIFTKRTNSNTNKICVGSGDIYKPVCRNCYDL